MIDRAADLLGVQLSGGAIRSPIAHGVDDGMRKKPLRVLGAHQHPGNSGSRNAMFVRRKETHFLQPQHGIGQTFNAQKRFPQPFVECFETGPVHRLLVYAYEPGLASSLRQTHPLVGRHRLF